MNGIIYQQIPLETFQFMWKVYVPEILYFIYSPQYLNSPYARKCLTASQMQNKRRNCEIAKILDLYLHVYNIPLYYLT